MAQQVGNHYQDGYNQALEEYVKAHASCKDAFLRVTGLTLHDICLALLHSKSQSRETVRNQVDPEQMYRLQNRKANQGREEDRQHLSQVGGQQELNGFPDIRIDPAAFLYRRYDSRKVVVSQNHVCYVLRYVGAGNPHADADIRTLDGGRVIYAVSSHGGNHALCLPSLYNADLMLRLHTGIYGKLLNPAVEFLVTDLVKLCSRDRLFRTGDNAKLHTDGYCRILVVTGNHNRPDAGLAAFYNRVLYLRAYRVDHTGKSHIGQILLQEFRLCICRDSIPVSLRAAEYAESLISHSLVGGQNRSTHFFCHRHPLSALHCIGTALQHLIRRSLCILNDPSVLCLMNGRHHLTHGIEGRLSHTGILLLQLRLLISILCGVIDKGALRRLSYCLAALRIPLSIGTERHANLQLLLIVRHMLYDGHLVLGQRTRLIGADNLRTSQSLHCCQLSDDRIPF